LIICWTDVSLAQDLPSSGRSRQAVERQRPLLQRDLAGKGFSWGAPIFIRIFKVEKQLEIWLKQGPLFKFFKSYPICTYGGKGLGPKIRQGDGKAPEGFYFVTPKQINPHSRYHLSFNLGYPNTYDRMHGYTGSALMVHGDCVSIGCFAMTDEAMEEIYTLADAALKNGQLFFRVHIFPFRMTEINMQTYTDSRWIDFWRNLQLGYEWFIEQGNIPPDVVVHQGRYRFVFALKSQ
jgi:murein L,D-transpeptidase YafK